MTSSSPYQYVIPTGLVVPDTSQTLTQVQQEWETAFGADLIVTPDTPQGVMITAETLARNNVINNNAAVANQINPNIAGGVFLDAILALTGVQREAQTPTVVPNVTVTGVVGTTIPQGVQAKTSAGDIFRSTSTVVIPSGGTTTVNFQAVEYGPVACAINALNTIVTAVIGWETVDNSTAGTLGTTTQSDAAARAFRQNTLAFQGLSLAEAITSALYAVPGVTSLIFQENVAGTTSVINSITMGSHSVYACVEGGTDNDVAAALLENKSSGAGWNGSTTVSVLEPASGQTYSVKFDRPAQIGILIRATVKNVSTDAATQALLDYANGVIPGVAGFVVGASVSPFELAGAIITENPGAYVSSCTISQISPVSFSVSQIPIAVNQIAITSLSNITITQA